MGEWKRNKRRTDGFPKGLLGKKVEARHRDGQIFTGVVGEHPYLNARSFNTADGMGGDVMSYRVVSEPADAPAITTPDHSKGFPVGTTAKDIGAKVWDEFVVVDSEHCHFVKGETVTLAEDDGTESPYFFGKGSEDLISVKWFRLAPIPPKTAIEPQAEEVGIPKPVQEWPENRIDVIGQNGNTGEHYEIDTSPERVENDAENAHVDMVNEPPHYKQGDVECIDAIRAALTDDEWRGYCKGNALKYIWRERHKGGDESLQKAIWYLNRLVK